MNERDERGNNLVPDFMPSVQDGAFCGFPFSCYGLHVDTRVKPLNPDMVARTVAPDYARGALLVADDVGNAVWCIAPATGAAGAK